MRISDWSSDVCSSDLRADLFHRSMPQPGLAAPDGGKHKQLWYALTNPTVNENKIKMTSRKIGYLCKDLHAKRVDADYLLHESVDFDDVTQALTQARTVFKLTE